MEPDRHALTMGYVENSFSLCLDCYTSFSYLTPNIDLGHGRIFFKFLKRFFDMFVLSILTSIKDKEINVSAAHRGQTLSNGGVCPGERASDRARERQTDRQTDKRRQTGRQTDRDLCLVDVVSTVAAPPQIRPLVRKLAFPN